jgi:hypothetical protein
MGINLPKLPPKSPDLNIIDHLWYRLKERTHDPHPELLTMEGSDETKKEALKAAIQHAWQEVREERAFVNHMVAKYRDRLEAVRLAEGKNTKY